ncbi:UNVERIFIED_CONTAM: hypothetical protein FKN15_021750 [Acipenser sinensis]
MEKDLPVILTSVAVHLQTLLQADKQSALYLKPCKIWNGTTRTLLIVWIFRARGNSPSVGKQSSLRVSASATG